MRIARLLLVLALNLNGYADQLFQALPYSEAVEVSQHQQKPLLLEFTASWCGPCKQMQKTTFSDPKVVEFCTKTYTPIQIDIDQQKELARQFSVNSIPCIVVLDPQGQVIDRVSGFQDSAQLLGWLANLGKVPTALESAHKQAAAEPDNAQARYDLAQLLADHGHWDECQVQALWCWDNRQLMEAQGLGALRRSFLVSLLNKVVKQSSSIRVQLEERYQAAKQGHDDASIQDWLALTRVLAKQAEAARIVLATPDLYHRQAQPIFELLCEQELWSQAGSWLRDPRALAERIDARRREFLNDAEQLEPEIRQPQTRFVLKHSRNGWRNLLKALSEAGKADEAARLRNWILEQDPEAESAPI